MKLFEDMYSVTSGGYEPPGTTHVKDEKGSTGPEGRAGASGGAGATGATGPEGQNGLNGATGATGPEGQRGAQGLIGATGPQGDTGATGAQGPAGLDGARGAQGPAGATGATGARGGAGERGRDGATGAEGPQGKIGPNGWTAIYAAEAIGAKRFIKVIDWVGGKGRRPKIGYLTPEGIGSIEDATDFRGARGPAGQRGHDGGGGGNVASGSGGVGATGATGPGGGSGGGFFFQPDPPANPNEGDRWFESDTGIQYTWVVDEDGGQWVDNSGPAGPIGATGATGATGPAGATGSNGATGATGPAGTNGTNGSDGADGATGPQGATGAQGVQGATGATGPAGAESFLDLTDTPDSYTGMGGKLVSVKSDETGIEFLDQGPLGQLFSFSSDPPYEALHGDEWMDSDNGSFYKFVNDEDSAQWVEIISSMGATGATGPAGANGADGATGATGPAGSAGAQGATGATGSFGDASATARIVARKTAGAGPFEEATLSEVLDFIGSAAHGDILYRGASAWARLAAGVSGKFLRTAGAGANPTWAYPETVKKTGGESVTNSTTLQNDNELLFPVAAGETVFFLLSVKFVEDGAENADIKFAMEGPAGLSDGQFVPINGIKVNESDAIVLQGAHNISGGGGAAIAFGCAQASRYAQFMGYIANGANAGNVQLTWAQNTAQTHAVIVQPGSAFIIWRT